MGRDPMHLYHRLRVQVVGGDEGGGGGDDVVVVLVAQRHLANLHKLGARDVEHLRWQWQWC